MDIEIALKSRSYILDLDHVRLSLGIFFFLSCLIESIFHQLSGSTFIFVKNTHQKTPNLRFWLISPVANSPAWFPEGQSTDWRSVWLQCTVKTAGLTAAISNMWSPDTIPHGHIYWSSNMIELSENSNRFATYLARTGRDSITKEVTQKWQRS